MGVPVGDAPSDELTSELGKAMEFFQDLSQVGLRLAGPAERPPPSRTPEERSQLVDYLVLYRRVRRLVS